MLGSRNAYIDNLKRQRSAWDGKASLRAVYHYWYRKIVAELAELRPTVELGCGCGNFREFYSEIIATDVFHTPWCDQITDACRMSFNSNSVGNLILFDVLHHIPTPLDFIFEAIRVLMPGGRIIMVEPFISLWSRFVYGYFHHEHFDPNADLFDSSKNKNVNVAAYSNGATSNIIFYQRYSQFMTLFPELKLVKREPFSFIVYPLTGGFSRFSIIPAFAVVPLSQLEDRILTPLYKKYLAMRLLVVLEKL